MKLYIVGPVSSGKSTVARLLSEQLSIPCASLDEIVHIPDPAGPWGNRKRTAEERDELFHSVIRQPEWIIEDVGRPCFEAGMREADAILLLDIPAGIRKYRIVKRWVRQKIGAEACGYSPRLRILKAMFQWTKDYDSGRDGLKERITVYQKKVVVLKSNQDIREYLERNVGQGR
jgi:Adenylate kinase and related kinases